MPFSPAHRGFHRLNHFLTYKLDRCCQFSIAVAEILMDTFGKSDDEIKAAFVAFMQKPAESDDTWYTPTMSMGDTHRIYIFEDRSDVQNEHQGG